MKFMTVLDARLLWLRNRSHRNSCLFSINSRREYFFENRFAFGTS